MTVGAKHYKKWFLVNLNLSDILFIYKYPEGKSQLSFISLFLAECFMKYGLGVCFRVLWMYPNLHRMTPDLRIS